MSHLLAFIKIIIGLSALCLFYGFVIEPKLLKTRYVSFDMPELERESLQIVLLSDLHIGGFHMPAKRVEKIVDRVNQLQPDMILIAGDFISNHVTRENQTAEFNAEVDTALGFLSKLEAPMGTHAAVGNHDVWYDVDYLKNTLTKNGLTVLQNQVRSLSDGLCLVGLADYETQEEDLEVFEGCDAGATIIALMHSPDSFKYLRSDTALALAGHTHGGQINIPLIGRRITSTSAGPKYAYGKLDVGGIAAFVTAGIGTSILPARFRAPPEIVLIEMHPR